MIPCIYYYFCLSFCLTDLPRLIQILLKTPISWPLFQDKLGKQHQKDYTILDFNKARDDGVAVASAGLYANHLTDRQTDRQTQLFV